MTLPAALADRLTLPAFCAPMFSVSGPRLVTAARRAGLVAGLPRKNCGDRAAFEATLAGINAELARNADPTGAHPVGPLAINLSTRLEPDELDAELAVCVRHGVDVIVSAAGDPTRLIRHAHARGLPVWHDVTSVRFAEKAIAAGADGLICIGAGGGGHSGTVSHLALVPRLRALFDGVLVMAGAVASGAAIRAAEILGADLAYLGTRFIATREADAAPGYKQMLVEENAAGLLYTPRITGVPANWMQRSLRANGLDPADLPLPRGTGLGHGHLPDAVRPWRTVWSAGQGIDLIDDIPEVAELVSRLRREYLAACATPDRARAAQLAEDALRQARHAPGD